MSSRIPPAMQTNIDRWLEHQCLSPNEWRVEPVSNAGRSVARIWKLSHQTTGFAIRNWGNSGRDRKSIQQILFFQKAVHLGLLNASSTGILLAGDLRHASIVPDIMAWTDQSWCLEYASSIWTIETWRPGVPIDAQAVVSEALLEQALDVLERLHAVGQQMGIHRVVAPGLVERMKQLDHWSSLDAHSWIQRLNDLEETISKILELRVWKDILNRTLDRFRKHEGSMRSGLQQLAASPVDCHWIIRDLWRENILVDMDRISGIIDFGAARIDWPVLECVRWLSSWLAPDDPRILPMLEGRKMLSIARSYRFLDQAATMLSLFQWFQWLLFSNISFQGREHRVQARVLELDQRLSKFSD